MLTLVHSLITAEHLYQRMGHMLWESTKLFKTRALSSRNSKARQEKRQITIHEWTEGNGMMVLARPHCWGARESYTVEGLWDHRKACASLYQGLAKRTAECDTDLEQGFQLGLKGVSISLSAEMVSWLEPGESLLPWGGESVGRRSVHRWREKIWQVLEDKVAWKHVFLPCRGPGRTPGSMMAICEQWVRAGKLDIRLWM